MMRHSCLFRPVSRLLGSILIYMAVTCSVSSCTDDTFNKYQQENTGLLTFDVKVPGNWANGLSRAATDISIKRMSQSAHAEPLYLVTEISEVAADAAASDAAAKEAATRGSMVNSTDDFHTNFGLSAICYTGAWPEEEPTDWGTDFAHNLKVTKDGTSWKLEKEKQLNWLGTGRIRFFAYSPYSAIDENGIIHSSTNKKGIPTLTYTVPTDVKKQQDLMTAMEDCSGGKGGAVNLNFKHALTAVTIKTGSAMLEGKITKVSFKGVYGAGTHQIGSDQWTTTGEPKEFSVGDLNIDLEKETPNEPTTKDENNADATAVNDGGIVDYAKPGTEIIDGDLTFLMIPQTLPKDATLEIEYQDKLTSTSRTLTAKLGEKGEKWPMGKKVAYSISSTGIIVGSPTIELKIDHHNIWMNGIEPSAAEQNAYLPVSGYLRDVQLAAYTKVTQAEEATKIINFSSSVEIEYSIDGGNTWTLTTKDTDGWLPAPQTKADISALANGDDPIPYVSGSILLPAQTSFQELRDKTAQHTDYGAFKLEMIGNNSSLNGYHDLVANNPVAKESANCYVINQPGYYKFPTWYGNTYHNSDNSAYTYKGSTSTLDQYILKNFVGHDDLAIDGTRPIPDIKDAVLVWQDSPDLVTDIKYENNWVYFYMPKEAFNQGNSVIAVRNEKGVILWSWHIWATYCDLNKYQDSKAANEKGRNFQFLRSNLGYCDPHQGNKQRTIKIRFYSTMPNGTRQQITNVSVTAGENPITKGEDGVLTFTQPAIIESMAGDNTYFQWGRKDPMLPGVYNQEIRDKAPLVDGFLPEGDWKYPYTDKGDGTTWVNYTEELDIVNKEFYSTTKYKFHSKECGRSIGESIQTPHLFFIHRRPGVNNATDKAHDKDGTQDYLRRHWHNGENTTQYNQKTIMNFWNSQLDTNGPVGKAESPNDKYVIKTIYDPSPAGYKIPPPTAFSKFAKPNNAPNTTPYGGSMPDKLLTDFKETPTGWEIREQEGGDLFFFPATGVRDMGIHHRAVDYGTFPAHSRLTFIASSGFHNTDNTSSSCLLFSIDGRSEAVTKQQHVGILYSTNNSYGFTLRPIRDHRQ